MGYRQGQKVYFKSNAFGKGVKGVIVGVVKTPNSRYKEYSIRAINRTNAEIFWIRASNVRKRA